MSEFCKNEVYLRGNVVSQPEYDHKCVDKEFYKFFVSTQRNSGVNDVIPVLVSKEMLDKFNIKLGDNIDISGEYRSSNNCKKLELYIFARKVTIYDEENFDNKILLTGFICRKGEIRETPKGKIIMDVLLAVNRSKLRSSYIPCIIWNVTEDEHKELNVGDEISIAGRIQSRGYIKKYEDETTEEKIAYEVSVKEYYKL